jgi:curli biogenesis system outer membrane secretion channel CsgG
MSRRHLSLVVVALASLVLSACSSSPTAPRSITPASAASAHDDIINPPTDTTSRSGYSGSNG